MASTSLAPGAAVAMVMISVGCTDHSPTAPIVPGVPSAQFAVTSAASSSTTSVMNFADLSVTGSSTLIRTDDGVSVRLSTSGLEPGSVATLWMVTFNKPQNCI